jgi:hypothetical protein
VSEKPRRHWNQFSLKRMLVVMTLLCIGPCTGVAYWRIEIRKRDAADFAVRSLGGVCWYHYGQIRAVQVSLADTKTADADVARIASLPGLSEIRSMNLGRTRITDAGMVHLACLKNLKVLNLHGTQVTDQGKNELQKALPELEITNLTREYWH